MNNVITLKKSQATGRITVKTNAGIVCRIPCDYSVSLQGQMRQAVREFWKKQHHSTNYIMIALEPLPGETFHYVCIYQ